MKKESMKQIRWTTGLMAAVALGAAPSVAGSDIQAYTISKGRLYQQDSAQAPQAVFGIPFVFLAALYSNDLAAVVDASFESPTGLSLPLGTGLSDNELTWEQPFDSESSLNATYPAGTYTMTFDTENDGFTSVSLSLPAASFPTAVPQIANFAMAQAIDAEADFVLSWNAFTGATGEDHYELSVNDENGFEVFSSLDVGTSVTIPAGTLSAEQSYEASLRFVHELGRNTTGYPGALGTAEIYNETSFSIATKAGGGGGGDDTTPPSLVSVSPVNGAKDVALLTPVVFTFSEPMATAQSMQWSANGIPIQVLANWGSDTILAVFAAAGLPSNSVISWTLNPTPNGPSNIKDVAGNPLPTISGSFTTVGGGPVDPCNNPGPSSGFYNISKTVSYVQTGTEAPVPDPEMPPTFGAGYAAPQGKTSTGAALRLPNGTSKPMNGFQGTFFLSEEFEGLAALEGAYPAATYNIEATGGTLGNATGPLALPSLLGIPKPQVSNLAGFAAMDPTKDFTLSFGAFTGAQANDGISLSLTGNNGKSIYWPDECRNRTLANTATSVVIPANTFGAGEPIRGTIMFTRGSVPNTTSIPGASGYASASIETQFSVTLGGGGGPGVAPVWSNPTLNPGQMGTFVLQGETGRTYVIETATQLNNWTPYSTNVAANGSVTVQVTTATPAARFFRARVQ